MDSRLGTALHLGNLRIAEIVQRVEQNRSRWVGVQRASTARISSSVSRWQTNSSGVAQ